MDTALYANVRAKLIAADTLRAKADSVIRQKQAEILATRKAKDDLFRLQQYDAKRADSLSTRLNQFQQDLALAQYQKVQARKAVDEVMKELPRKVRIKLVVDGAGPDLIATNVVAYVKTLRNRKWSWAGGGVLFGTLVTLIASLR